MDGPTRCVIALECEQHVSPAETAAALTRILNKSVTAVAVDESEIIQLFLKRELFRGFNSGYIRSEGIEERLYGSSTLELTMRNLCRTKS